VISPDQLDRGAVGLGGRAVMKQRRRTFVSLAIVAMPIVAPVM